MHFLEVLIYLENCDSYHVYASYIDFKSQKIPLIHSCNVLHMLYNYMIII